MTFSSGSYAAGSFPRAVAVGDFNADFDPDLAVANFRSNNVSVLINTSEPAVALTPASLDFGSQLVNTTSSPKTVQVANTGDAHLRIEQVHQVAGTNAADFDIGKDRCTGASLQVGESCPIAVAFTPIAKGARSANLRITSNAPDSPHSVPLSGTGTFPACAGQTATIVGTPGPDSLTGTAGNDIVALLDGDDTLMGGGGNDIVCGGAGDDELIGQPGADGLYGRSDDDELFGVAGADKLYGRSGDDFLSGGTESDTCAGGSDTDEARTCETLSGIP